VSAEHLISLNASDSACTCCHSPMIAFTMVVRQRVRLWRNIHAGATLPHWFHQNCMLSGCTSTSNPRFFEIAEPVASHVCHTCIGLVKVRYVLTQSQPVGRDDIKMFSTAEQSVITCLIVWDLERISAWSSIRQDASAPGSQRKCKPITGRQNKMHTMQNSMRNGQEVTLTNVHLVVENIWPITTMEPILHDRCWKKLKPFPETKETQYSLGRSTEVYHFMKCN
jgi:hypothetical protein